MFTGIIQEVGRVRKILRKGGVWTFEIATSQLLSKTNPGDSVAVNGVCLTVTTKRLNVFSVDVVKATLTETNLKRLKVGARVNLELALAVGDKLSGHFVLGHVDCEVVLKSIQRRGGEYLLQISYPAKFRKYLVDKCSVSLDGISLTVQKVFHNYFSVSIIPYTYNNTNLRYRRPGDYLNIEFDYLLKKGQGI